MTVTNPESQVSTLLSTQTGEVLMRIEIPHPETMWLSLFVLRDRLSELASHFSGKVLMTYLKMRYRDVMREAEPLTMHLEGKIYPIIRGTRTH